MSIKTLSGRGALGLDDLVGVIDVIVGAKLATLSGLD